MPTAVRSAAGAVFTLAEKYDIFGRSEGYALSNLTAGAEALIAATMQNYDTAGRLERVAVSGAGEFGLTGGLTGDALCVKKVAL